MVSIKNLKGENLEVEYDEEFKDQKLDLKNRSSKEWLLKWTGTTEEQLNKFRNLQLNQIDITNLAFGRYLLFNINLS